MAIRRRKVTRVREVEIRVIEPDHCKEELSVSVEDTPLMMIPKKAMTTRRTWTRKRKRSMTLSLDSGARVKMKLSKGMHTRDKTMTRMVRMTSMIFREHGSRLKRSHDCS